MPQLAMHSPVGELTLIQRGDAIATVRWGAPAAADIAETPLLVQARQQLERYFAGDMTPFNLPLAPVGNAFRQQVWALTQEIPAGRTMTYGDMAKRLKAEARAVGGACGANPIPIIIPCHRVVGSGHRLVGYSGHGGIETKVRLLQLEGVLL